MSPDVFCFVFFVSSQKAFCDTAPVDGYQSSCLGPFVTCFVLRRSHRTQRQNRHAAMQKLREMIDEAWEPAKERKMRTGVSKAGKEMRLAEKHRRAKVKRGVLLLVRSARQGTLTSTAPRPPFSVLLLLY